MRTITATDDILWKETMAMDSMYSTKATTNKMLRKSAKTNNRKQLLKYKGAAIWEGILDEMRIAR